MWPTWGESLDITKNDEIYFSAFGSNCGSSLCHSPNIIMICKLDLNLNIIWQKFYTGNEFYTTLSIISTNDGGCLILGEILFITNNEVDLYLMKVDSEGNLTHINGESIENLLKELILYPNPATDFINIRLGAHLHDVVIEIYDISGKQLLLQNLENTETQINISDFKSGTYIYKCYNNERIIENGKFVKE